MGGDYKRSHSSRSHKNRSRRRRSRSTSRSRSRSRSGSPSNIHRPNRLTRRLLPCHVELRGQRKPSKWDIAPEGYEHLTPLQYKKMQASGEISSRILGNMAPAGESAALAMATRQARRLYVGNIPFNCQEQDMCDFFQNKMHRLTGGGAMAENTMLMCQINADKNFAFLEFRSMDEATLAMTLDGVYFNGQSLKIRRPHDYTPLTVSSNSSSGISCIVPDTSNKVYIGGLPLFLEEQQVTELLATFGELRGFNLIKDTQTRTSKGYAFCEYKDPNVTELAIAGLNGMQLGERKLVVERSISGIRNVQSQVLQVPGMVIDAEKNQPTEVVCLLNMVEPEELRDDMEYEDIKTDICNECVKYGSVHSIHIPRPDQPGCGKIYIRFVSVEDAKAAMGALTGRQFSGRIVMTTFYDLGKYKAKEFQ